MTTAEIVSADLAGIGADEIAQRQIAALDDLQGGDKLALEQLGAAAVMRQRCHRADHRQLAHVAGAVVAFQRPDRHDHRRRHAILLLDAPEQGGVHLHQFPGAVDAGRDDPGGGVFLEALGVEHAALAAVEGEDGGVGCQAGEGLVDDAARDALALRVARDRRQESVEVAAAWRGARGGCEEQQDESKEEAAGLPHPRILSRNDPTRHLIRGRAERRQRYFGTSATSPRRASTSLLEAISWQTSERRSTPGGYKP